MKDAITKLLGFIGHIIHIDDNEYPPVERFIRCEYKQSDWEWAREKHGIPSKVQYSLKFNRL